MEGEHSSNHRYHQNVEGAGAGSSSPTESIVSGIGCLRTKKRSNKIHSSAQHVKLPIIDETIAKARSSRLGQPKILSQNFSTPKPCIRAAAAAAAAANSNKGIRPSRNFTPSISATELIHTQFDSSNEIQTNTGIHKNEECGQSGGLLIEPSLLFPRPHSLLGVEEMEKYLPKRQVIVQISTWNMGSLPLPHENQLIKLFGHKNDCEDELSTKKIDLHVIGIQECWPDVETWELVLQTTLGNGFALFHSLSFGTLHLSIFIRRDLLWFTTDPFDTTTSVRSGRLFKTKGATGISFGLFGSRLLFINAHLSAGTVESYAAQRVEELRKIMTAAEKVKDHYDAVFLFGDLNFRVFGMKYEAILETLVDNNINPLLEHDQLAYIFRRKDTLPAFLEPFHEAAAITFRPTYKYDVGRDTFDSSSKQRAPAYTDRIIYKNKILPNGNANVFCIAYDGIFNMRVSDHRPVYGIFSIELRPGSDTQQLSGARFKRDLYVKALQNQAKYLMERRKKLASSICVIS